MNLRLGGRNNAGYSFTTRSVEDDDLIAFLLSHDPDAMMSFIST
ncbi:MAG: hypothetical protein PVJ98_11555 [Akkermansiaceae bacterium]